MIKTSKRPIVAYKKITKQSKNMIIAVFEFVMAHIGHKIIKEKDHHHYKGLWPTHFTKP